MVRDVLAPMTESASKIANVRARDEMDEGERSMTVVERMYGGAMVLRCQWRWESGKQEAKSRYGVQGIFLLLTHVV